jgi:hypothetical protein
MVFYNPQQHLLPELRALHWLPHNVECLDAIRLLSPKLSTLSLVGHHSTSDDLLAFTADLRREGLEVLEIRTRSALPVATETGTPSENVSSIFGLEPFPFPFLKSLHLDDPNVRSFPEMLRIVSSLSNLISLSLGTAESLLYSAELPNSTPPSPIFQSLRNLKLYGESKVITAIIICLTNNTLEDLFCYIYFPNATEVAGFFDALGSTLSKSLLVLRVQSLSDFKINAANFSTLALCAKLREFTFSAFNQLQVNDIIVEQLCASLRNLEVLSLAPRSEKGPQHLIRTGNVLQHRLLDPRPPPSITFKGFFAILERCPRLRSLGVRVDLCDAGKYMDQDIKLRTSSLTHLDGGGSANDDAATVAAILSGVAPSLQHLQWKSSSLGGNGGSSQEVPRLYALMKLVRRDERSRVS